MENLKSPKTLFSALVLTLVIVAINAYFSSRSPAPEEMNDAIESKEDNRKPLDVETKAERKIASAELIKADIYKPGIKRTALRKSDFQDISAPEFYHSSPASNHIPERDSTSDHSPIHSPSNSESHQIDSDSEEKNVQQNSQNMASKTKGTESVYGPYYVTPEIKDSKGPKSVTKTSTISSSNIAPPPPPELIQNTCSASISGGSFNHPIGVTLSCSSASVITYCLGKDTGSGCCDPHVSGTTYTTKIGIGASNANYCLSFYGDSTLLGLSETYQKNYAINSTLPHLQIGHQQNYYQTTQLSGKVFLSSLDFGKANHGVGVLNLKTHDPGISGENLSCEEIAQNSSILLAPTPLDVLTLLDVSLEDPTTQLEIPLRLDHLDYGINFITGFMLNDNYDLPLYSCSTSEVVLSDFEFFEQQLTFGEPGNNSTREFTGGLTSFGFFESDATLYRGPAGVSAEDQTGERLQYGLFGIFF